MKELHIINNKEIACYRHGIVMFCLREFNINGDADCFISEAVVNSGVLSKKDICSECWTKHQASLPKSRDVRGILKE